MKKLFLFFISLFAINSYAQITFEQGYYIDNAGQKTICLIKNEDWSSGPQEFKYKLSENEQQKTISIAEVKEFGILNVAKYIKAVVDIDISDQSLNEIISVEKPDFKKEELFLKVIIEGKASLYEGGKVKKYFFNLSQAPITQLVYKTYKNDENQIAYNNQFRKQLWDNLQCGSLQNSDFTKLEYKRSALISLFSAYNKCSNSDFVSYTNTKKRDAFNLNIRPRLNNNSLLVTSEVNNYESTDFQNKLSFGLGLEAEFILPFNRNKWSIIIEPSFQSYKSSVTKEYSSQAYGRIVGDVNYNSIEIPVGIRHYFFVNKDSKIFINASYVFDVNLNSSVDFSVDGRQGTLVKDFDTATNFAFGLGYKYIRYSLEMRFSTSRNLMTNYHLWNTDYKSASIILGYTLF